MKHNYNIPKLPVLILTHYSMTKCFPDVFLCSLVPSNKQGGEPGNEAMHMPSQGSRLSLPTALLNNSQLCNVPVAVVCWVVPKVHTS